MLACREGDNGRGCCSACVYEDSRREPTSGEGIEGESSVKFFNGSKGAIRARGVQDAARRCCETGRGNGKMRARADVLIARRSTEGATREPRMGAERERRRDREKESRCRRNQVKGRNLDQRIDINNLKRGAVILNQPRFGPWRHPMDRTSSLLLLLSPVPLPSPCPLWRTSASLPCPLSVAV